MDNSNQPFYETLAIEVNQPLGAFYVFKIPATKLVEITFSMAAYSQDGKLSGVQRKLKDERIKQIALFSGTKNATLPSSIILSANFESSGQFVEDEEITWKVVKDKIVIPSNKPLASIIDGQHRVEGIKKAIKDGIFIDFDILCSVYIDLPFPQQAEIFTSINYNQKKVDKSVAYELFGYDLEDTDVKNWSPDTLAIYFARVLNNDKKSPLNGHIYSSLQGSIKHDKWFISTACIVESICLLFTNDATKDRYVIHQSQSSLFNASGRDRLKQIKSNAPLRQLYIERKDKDIFEYIMSFLNKVDSLGWFSDTDLVTTKTIGFLAMFEILKEILKDPSKYDKSLKCLEKVDIKDLQKDTFSFSGIGKSQVKSILKRALD